MPLQKIFYPIVWSCNYFNVNVHISTTGYPLKLAGPYWHFCPFIWFIFTFRQCDCLLVFGTSLAVAPFNGLIAKPASTSVRVFINRMKPGSDPGLVGWVMGMGRKSVNFDGPNDLVILNDCDKTVRDICREVEWEEELDSIEVRILEP